MDGYVAPKRRIFRFAFFAPRFNSSSASAKLLEEMGQAQECGAFRHCLSRSKARSICWFQLRNSHSTHEKTPSLSRQWRSQKCFPYGVSTAQEFPLGSVCARWTNEQTASNDDRFISFRRTPSTLANLFGLSADMQQTATERTRKNLEGWIRGTRWVGIGHTVMSDISRIRLQLPEMRKDGKVTLVT